MKKLTLFLCIFCLAITGLSAQKGSWYAGGQVGYMSQTEESPNASDVKTNTWSFAPEIGTFLQNSLQLGFAINLSGGTQDDGSSEIKATRFSPVLYLRKFFPMGDRFSTFVGIVGTITTGSVDMGDQTADLGGGGINLSLGAAVALSPRFTAVGQYGLFGYTSETYEDDSGKYTTSNFGLNVNSLGPVLNVGLYYTFKQAK